MTDFIIAKVMIPVPEDRNDQEVQEWLEWHLGISGKVDSEILEKYGHGIDASEVDFY